MAGNSATVAAAATIIRPDAAGNFVIAGLDRSAIAHVDIVDVDIVLISSGGQRYILPGAGIAAMSHTPPNVVFADGPNSLSNMLGQVKTIDAHVTEEPLLSSIHQDASSVALSQQVQQLQKQVQSLQTQAKADQQSASQSQSNNVSSLDVSTDNSIEKMVAQAEKIEQNLHTTNNPYVPVEAYKPATPPPSPPAGEPAPTSNTPIMVLNEGNLVDTDVSATANNGYTTYYGAGGAAGSDAAQGLSNRSSALWSAATITGDNGNDIIYAEGALAGDQNPATAGHQYTKQFLLNVAGTIFTLSSITIKVDNSPMPLTIVGATYQGTDVNGVATWVLPASYVEANQTFTIHYNTDSASIANISGSGSFNIEMFASGTGAHGASFSISKVLTFQLVDVTSLNQFENIPGDSYILPIGDQPNVITAGDGNNIVYGSRSNDTITLGNGNNTVTDGSGTDVITVGNGNNTLTAGDGNDTVSAGGGNNAITLGNGNSTVRVGDGNNTIVTGSGSSAITIGSGNDTVTVGTLTGTGSNTIHVDNLSGTTSAYALVMKGTGTNTINSDNGYAGDGNFTVTAGSGNNSITLGNGTISVDAINSAGSTAVSVGNGTSAANSYTINIGNGAHSAVTTAGGSGSSGTIAVGSGDGDSIATGLGTYTITVGGSTGTTDPTLLASGQGDSIAINGSHATVYLGDHTGTAGTVSITGGTTTLHMGTGSNAITASAATATLDFSSLSGAISIDASSSAVGIAVDTATGGSNLTDQFTGITTILGTNHGDHIELGVAGMTYDGGTGNDTVLLDNFSTGQGVTVNLGTKTGGNTDSISVGRGTNAINNGIATDTLSLNGADFTSGANVTFTALGNNAYSIASTDGSVATTEQGMAALHGTNNGDTVRLASAGLTFNSGSGNDAITISNTAGDTVDLGAGTSTVYVGTGSNTIAGGTGVGTLSFNDSAITAGLAGLTITTASVTGTANGVALHDTISGVTHFQGTSYGDNVTLASAGLTYTGGGGNDAVTIGNLASGGDTLILGNGSNTVNVGNSSDTITLGNGANTVNINGTGTDTITAGSGTNVMSFAGFGSSVTINAPVSGAITATGTGLSDSFTGFATIRGSNNGDTVNLNGSGLTFNGGSGINTVNANATSGTDVISGGSGNNSTINFGNVTSAMTITVNAVAGTSNTAKIGASTIDSFGGFSNIDGTNNGDTVILNASGVTFHDGSGNDTVTISNTAGDTVDLGAGTSTVYVGTGSNTIAGGTGVGTLSFNDSAITAGLAGLTITTASVTGTANGIALHDTISGVTHFQGTTYGDNVTLASAGLTFSNPATLTTGDTIATSGGDTLGSSAQGLYGANAITLGASGSDTVYLTNGTNTVTFNGGSETVKLDVGSGLTGGSLIVKGAASSSSTGNVLTGSASKLDLSNVQVAEKINTTASAVGGVAANTLTGSGNGSVSTSNGGLTGFTSFVGSALGGDIVALAAGQTFVNPSTVTSGDTITTSGSDTLGTSLQGLYGNNVLTLGTSGHDTVYLANGNNTLTLGTGGYESVTAGNGTNIFNVYGSHDALTVGTGVNAVNVKGNGTSNSFTFGGTGNSLNFASLGEAVTLNTALGTVKDSTATLVNDTFTVSAFSAFYGTTSYNDTVVLGSANQSFTGYAGNDNVTGASAGSDTITLGAGASTVKLYGSSNTVTVGNGANSIDASASTGSNTFTLGTGADTVYVGTGTNTFTGTGGTNSIVSFAKLGSALSGSSGSFTISSTQATGTVGGVALTENYTSGTITSFVGTSYADQVILSTAGITFNVPTGGGADTITISSGGDHVGTSAIPLGGNNTINVNGSGSTVYLGGGTNTVVVASAGINNSFNATGSSNILDFSSLTQALTVALNVSGDTVQDSTSYLASKTAAQSVVYDTFAGVQQISGSKNGGDTIYANTGTLIYHSQEAANPATVAYNTIYIGGAGTNTVTATGNYNQLHIAASGHSLTVAYNSTGSNSSATASWSGGAVNATFSGFSTLYDDNNVSDTININATGLTFINASTSTGDTITTSGSDTLGTSSQGLYGSNTITLGSGGSDKVYLGVGTNVVTLGSGGSETVTAGNGSNAIYVKGSNNSVTLGTGVNALYITGVGTSNTLSPAAVSASTSASTLTYNGSAVSSGNVLVFSSLPTGLSVGDTIADLTNASAYAVGTTVVGINAATHTVVLSNNVTALQSVGYGDTFSFSGTALDLSQLTDGSSHLLSLGSSASPFIIQTGSASGYAYYGGVSQGQITDAFSNIAMINGTSQADFIKLNSANLTFVNPSNSVGETITTIGSDTLGTAGQGLNGNNTIYSAGSDTLYLGSGTNTVHFTGVSDSVRIATGGTLVATGTSSSTNILTGGVDGVPVVASTSAVATGPIYLFYSYATDFIYGGVGTQVPNSAVETAAYTSTTVNQLSLYNSYVGKAVTDSSGYIANGTTATQVNASEVTLSQPALQSIPGTSADTVYINGVPSGTSQATAAANYGGTATLSANAVGNVGLLFSTTAATSINTFYQQAVGYNVLVTAVDTTQSKSLGNINGVNTTAGAVGLASAVTTAVNSGDTITFSYSYGGTIYYSTPQTTTAGTPTVANATLNLTSAPAGGLSSNGSEVVTDADGVLSAGLYYNVASYSGTTVTLSLPIKTAMPIGDTISFKTYTIAVNSLPSNVTAGYGISGAGIPSNTIITGISGNTLTLSAALTGLVTSGETLTFTAPSLLFSSTSAESSLIGGARTLTFSTASLPSNIAVGEIITDNTNANAIASGTTVTRIATNASLGTTTLTLSQDITANIAATDQLKFTGSTLDLSSLTSAETINTGGAISGGGGYSSSSISGFTLIKGTAYNPISGTGNVGDQVTFSASGQTYQEYGYSSISSHTPLVTLTGGTKVATLDLSQLNSSISLYVYGNVGTLNVAGFSTSLGSVATSSIGSKVLTFSPALSISGGPAAGNLVLDITNPSALAAGTTVNGPPSTTSGYVVNLSNALQSSYQTTDQIEFIAGGLLSGTGIALSSAGNSWLVGSADVRDPLATHLSISGYENNFSNSYLAAGQILDTFTASTGGGQIIHGNSSSGSIVNLYGAASGGGANQEFIAGTGSSHNTVIMSASYNILTYDGLASNGGDAVVLSNFTGLSDVWLGAGANTIYSSGASNAVIHDVTSSTTIDFMQVSGFTGSGAKTMTMHLGPTGLSESLMDTVANTTLVTDAVPGTLIGGIRDTLYIDAGIAGSPVSFNYVTGSTFVGYSDTLVFTNESGLVFNTVGTTSPTVEITDGAYTNVYVSGGNVGGAIYFNASNSQIYLHGADIQALYPSSAASTGNVPLQLYLKDGSTLTAYESVNATFSGNAIVTPHNAGSQTGYYTITSSTPATETFTFSSNNAHMTVHFS